MIDKEEAAQLRTGLGVQNIRTDSGPTGARQQGDRT